METRGSVELSPFYTNLISEKTEEKVRMLTFTSSSHPVLLMPLFTKFTKFIKFMFMPSFSGCIKCGTLVFGPCLS